LTNQKQKFVKYLLAVTVSLLVINIAIESLKKPKKDSAVHELSVIQIETVFFTVLDDYGIETKWITRKKYKSADYDSVKTEYIVKIPADMPVPLIIKNINKVIEKDITGFVSEEKKIFGTTEIRIYTNEVLKLKATLIPDKEIIRKRNELSFVINDVFDLSEKNFNNFLNFNYLISCTIIPGHDLIIKADSLKDYTKEYAILLNNDITDPKMKLKSDYQKGLLKGSMQNIISNFRDAKTYIIDENSTLYNSPIYNYIRDEFRRQSIFLYPRSELIELNAQENSELISKFKFYCEDTTGVHQKIFFSSFDNFLKIQNEIEKIKKKGNKIIPLSKTFLARKPVALKTK
jgi:hypothetical protein